MFNVRQIKKLYEFMEDLYKRGFRTYFEVSEAKVFVEFEVGEFKYLEKYIKDWLMFNSDIIVSYVVEWTDDDICRYNLFLNRGDI